MRRFSVAIILGLFATHAQAQDGGRYVDARGCHYRSVMSAQGVIWRPVATANSAQRCAVQVAPLTQRQLPRRDGSIAPAQSQPGSRPLLFGAQPPAGAVPVWQDGRLNARRGVRVLRFGGSEPAN